MGEPEPPSADYHEYPQLYGDLFEAVQLSGMFEDSKTFVDAVPTSDPDDVRAAFDAAAAGDDELAAFVDERFDLPEEVTAGVEQPLGDTMSEHVRELWPHLTTSADDEPGELSTRLPLPNPYIKPGGRFREIYYWDTYFTAEGLVRSGMVDVVENMVDNFASLIDRVGFVPNGNRVYYLGRSQPPLFCQLLTLLERARGPQAPIEYLPQLRAEYDFWMDGADDVSPMDPAHRRVVRLSDGSVLNRYWDDYPVPRPESYAEDVAVADEHEATDETVYRHLRAAAESGWDFSSRWFADYETLETIRTTDVVPVDLNVFLYDVERNIARWCRMDDRPTETVERYDRRARARAEAIRSHHWDPERGFFFDYCWPEGESTDVWSLAGVVPLFADVATTAQAESVARVIERRFLHDGGLPVTLRETGEQWDFPAGWAPLTWLTVVGLENYGHDDLARSIGRRWLDMAEAVFEDSGVMMEKYDVDETAAAVDVGEYVGQVGFGWTNGVTLALQEQYGRDA